METLAPQYPPQSLVVDGLTGIVSFVKEIECQRSDPDVFVTVAQSGDLSSLGFPGGHRYVLGSGAALTYDQAVWAAVGEVIERYCLQVVPTEDLVVASWRELRARGEEALSPQRWAPFDPSQHRSGKLFYDLVDGAGPHAANLDRTHSAGKVFYEPFDEDTRVVWVKVDGLTHRRECYVPASLVYFLMCPIEGAKALAPGISTGAACARTAGEGLFKAICEVLERDAFMIMWRNQLPCPRVEIDPASPIHDLVREKFLRPGFEFTLVQTTLDSPIPSFFGIVRNCRRNPPLVVVGGACHPDPNQAVLKTLFELAQGIQWANCAGHKTFPVEEGYANIRSFDDRMELYAFGNQQEAFRFLLDHPNVIKLSSIPSVDLGDDRANTRRCCEELAKRNVELLAADITSSDVAEAGLSVIRVISPECEAMEADHRMPFLGGKRWREVPVQLGLRSEPLSLENVNPFPHPYP